MAPKTKIQQMKITLFLASLIATRISINATKLFQNSLPQDKQTI